MGESAACLVRSFSQPSPTSGEEKKVSHFFKIHCIFYRLSNQSNES